LNDLRGRRRRGAPAAPPLTLHAGRCTLHAGRCAPHAGRSTLHAATIDNHEHAHVDEVRTDLPRRCEPARDFLSKMRSWLVSRALLAGQPRRRRACRTGAWRAPPIMPGRACGCNTGVDGGTRWTGD
jgi:hypothetical protein